MEEKEMLVQLKKMSSTVTDILCLVNLFVPKELTVSSLAKSLGKDPKTIRVHLEGNFIKGVDYFQELEKGKIQIPRATALAVSEYYVRKEAKDV